MWIMTQSKRTIINTDNCISIFVVNLSDDFSEIRARYLNSEIFPDRPNINVVVIGEHLRENSQDILNELLSKIAMKKLYEKMPGPKEEEVKEWIDNPDFSDI